MAKRVVHVGALSITSGASFIDQEIRETAEREEMWKKEKLQKDEKEKAATAARKSVKEEPGHSSNLSSIKNQTDPHFKDPKSGGDDNPENRTNKDRDKDEANADGFLGGSSKVVKESCPFESFPRQQQGSEVGSLAEVEDDLISASESPPAAGNESSRNLAVDKGSITSPEQEAASTVPPEALSPIQIEEEAIVPVKLPRKLITDDVRALDGFPSSSCNKENSSSTKFCSDDKEATVSISVAESSSRGCSLGENPSEEPFIKTSIDDEISTEQNPYETSSTENISIENRLNEKAPNEEIPIEEDVPDRIPIEENPTERDPMKQTATDEDPAERSSNEHLSTEESAPKEENASNEESVSKKESAPKEESAPIEESAPKDKRVPKYEDVSMDEGVSKEEGIIKEKSAALKEENAPKKEDTRDMEGTRDKENASIGKITTTEKDTADQVQNLTTHSTKTFIDVNSDSETAASEQSGAKAIPPVAIREAATTKMTKEIREESEDKTSQITRPVKSQPPNDLSFALSPRGWGSKPAVVSPVTPKLRFKQASLVEEKTDTTKNNDDAVDDNGRKSTGNETVREINTSPTPSVPPRVGQNSCRQASNTKQVIVTSQRTGPSFAVVSSKSHQHTIMQQEIEEAQLREMEWRKKQKLAPVTDVVDDHETNHDNTASEQSEIQTRNSVPANIPSQMDSTLAPPGDDRSTDGAERGSDEIVDKIATGGSSEYHKKTVVDANRVTKRKSTMAQRWEEGKFRNNED